MFGFGPVKLLSYWDFQEMGPWSFLYFLRAFFSIDIVVVFLQIMLSFHQSYKQYLKECVTVQTSCLAGNWRSAVYFVTGSLPFKSSFA